MCTLLLTCQAAAGKGAREAQGALLLAAELAPHALHAAAAQVAPEGRQAAPLRSRETLKALQIRRGCFVASTIRTRSTHTLQGTIAPQPHAALC
jgi:hypothetical protein